MLINGSSDTPWGLTLLSVNRSYLHMSQCSRISTMDRCLFPMIPIPWRRKWQPTPVFLPGELHGQRSLAGHSSWGHKELDTHSSLPLNPPGKPHICASFGSLKQIINNKTYVALFQFHRNHTWQDFCYPYFQIKNWSFGDSQYFKLSWNNV